MRCELVGRVPGEPSDTVAKVERSIEYRGNVSYRAGRLISGLFLKLQCYVLKRNRFQNELRATMTYISGQVVYRAVNYALTLFFRFEWFFFYVLFKNQNVKAKTLLSIYTEFNHEVGFELKLRNSKIYFNFFRFVTGLFWTKHSIQTQLYFILNKF